jgi:anti-sigma regulatory factor (Ser/Thr protein kinase)
MAGRGVRGEGSSHDAGGDAALSGTITLPGVERSVAHGRRFVRETLGPRHPALEKAAIGVSELATNAIMHTPSGDGGQITIGVAVNGTFVRVEVTNDGTMAGKPRVRHDIDAESGRGILIVDALADAWGVTETSGATTVWAEFRSASWSLPRPGATHARNPGAQHGSGLQNGHSARQGDVADA